MINNIDTPIDTPNGATHSPSDKEIDQANEFSYTSDTEVDKETDNKEYLELKQFDELEISESILRGIFSMGFEFPSSIQRIAIRPMLDDRDLIAQAQSGTGKTATFLIASLNKIDKSIKKPQVIVLCPNRELAQQIYFNCEGLNIHHKVTGALIMGGTLVEDNFKALDRGVQFIIGTPGRIYDMMKRYVLKTDSLKCFIMDEADEMLSKGFKDQVYEIFQFIPKKAQICLFSATMPNTALELTDKFMRNPNKLLVKSEEITLEGIKQYYLGVEQENWKTATLYDLYENLSMKQTIIFCNSKRKAEWLKDSLMEENFTVSCIHSDLPQIVRDKTMKSFRTGISRVLIATDVIARGIDVQQVEIVINFDIPREIETYIHRIGRSGRFGRKGLAINFVTDKEYPHLERIQQYYCTNIEPLPDNIKELIK
jgi:translation initiation factor 4A